MSSLCLCPKEYENKKQTWYDIVLVSVKICTDDPVWHEYFHLLYWMPKDSIKPAGYQFPRQFIRQKKCIIIDPGFDGTHSILNTSSVHLRLSNILFFYRYYVLKLFWFIRNFFPKNFRNDIYMNFRHSSHLCRLASRVSKWSAFLETNGVKQYTI